MYQQPNYNGYYPQRTITPTLNLKGHPVASFEEVKASAVDFDGTISYFPDVANNCIYTKQINIDGTVTLKKFGLTELPNEQSPQDNTYTLGACVKDNTTIYINNKLNKKKLKRVLCHEFAHAAMFSYNVYMTLEEEEFFANLISLYGYEIISKANNFFSQLYK